MATIEPLLLVPLLYVFSNALIRASGARGCGFPFQRPGRGAKSDAE